MAFKLPDPVQYDGQSDSEEELKTGKRWVAIIPPRDFGNAGNGAGDPKLIRTRIMRFTLGSMPDYGPLKTNPHTGRPLPRHFKANKGKKQMEDTYTVATVLTQVAIIADEDLQGILDQPIRDETAPVGINIYVARSEYDRPVPGTNPLKKTLDSKPLKVNVGF